MLLILGSDAALSEQGGISAESVSFAKTRRRADSVKLPPDMKGAGCIRSACAAEGAWSVLNKMPGVLCTCCDPREYEPFASLAKGQIAAIKVRWWSSDTFGRREDVVKLLLELVAQEPTPTKGYFEEIHSASHGSLSVYALTKDPMGRRGSLYVWGNRSDGRLAFKGPDSAWRFSAWAEGDGLWAQDWREMVFWECDSVEEYERMLSSMITPSRE